MESRIGGLRSAGMSTLVLPRMSIDKIVDRQAKELT